VGAREVDSRWFKRKGNSLLYVSCFFGDLCFNVQESLSMEPAVLLSCAVVVIVAVFSVDYY